MEKPMKAAQKSDESGVPIEKPAVFKELILYNMAGFSLNIYDTILAAWILFFYAPPENLGHIQFVPMAILGTILAGGRILDAITDPLVGYLSDNAHTRWGRRKPFIFIANPILYLSFVLIWFPPIRESSTTNAIFLAAVLFFYYWAYTGVLIPWFAVLPELRAENRSRVKIATAGVAIGVIGALVGGGLSGPMLKGMGAFWMAVILGAAAFIGGELTLLGITERYRPDNSAAPPGFIGFLRMLKQVFADRQVLSFAIMIMLVQLTYQLMLMNVPYFTTIILGRDESDASMLMATVIIIMAVSTPLWYFLLSKFPKRTVFRVIMICMAFGFVLGFFVGHYPIFSPYVQSIIIFSVIAIPVGGMFSAVLGIIADLTDYDELKSGRRREAVYYGIYGIVRKTGWACCPLIIVGIFSLFGSSVENPNGIRIVWLVCAAVCLLGWVVFWPYKIGDSQEETREIMNL
jgi:GPH family glycoside/pentoside/hexuronide:cation symporter